MATPIPNAEQITKPTIGVDVNARDAAVNDSALNTTVNATAKSNPRKREY
jgi:hypothetical protein